MYTVELTESYFPAQTDMDVRESTVGSILREAAQTWPDNTALVESDEAGETGRSWTYTELLADADALADALLTRFRPGERIVVWAHNIPEWILCEYAFGIAGLVLVTANPGYQPRELAYVIGQSNAVGLFVVESFRGNPVARIAREVAADIPSVREVTDLQNHDQLFARGDIVQDRPDVSPSDIAQIQYTSGSTGFPKGVLLHHRGLTNNSRHYTRFQGMPETPTSLLIAPLFHTAGCAMMVLGQGQAGGTIIAPPLFDPALANLLIEKHDIAVAGGVPTMMMMMIEAASAEPRDFSSVTHITAGGSMVAPELIKRIEETFGCSFATVYGLTETCPLITSVRPEDSLEDKAYTVGQPVPQCAVSIRSIDDNAVVPVGTVGEICARGYNVMEGYNDNPEATAATIDADGWLHTGDLGTMDARGYVKITGRVKEMIIRGGENLFPVEIENVLLEHSDVAQVAVVGLPDEKWGEIVAAFVRVADGAEFDPAALKAHCRSILAAQKTPSVWVAVKDYPMTGSGKVQKFQLRDAYLAGDYGEEGAA
ncbi:class I adenylate-forming enzyme family protein [Qipengyuania flava]|uniref:class I adenylate-forming enzyme family protein n=1 Tax=Qipengyuania flava TaxID=192812 RepID=UPI001C62CCC8|nr:AMP-binding protein [Qipengyuania flava]QYJ06515.1 AMP-binding protein [Qipengyuania flava]